MESNHEAWGDSGPIVDPFPPRSVPEVNLGRRSDYSSAPERTNCLIVTASASGEDKSNGNSAGSCHPGDARQGSGGTDPNMAPDGSGTLGQHQLQHGISSRFSSPGQASNPHLGTQNLTNTLSNAHHLTHLEAIEQMDVSDLIPPGALDMAQNMDNSVHGRPSESGQLANLFEIFGLPSSNGDGSQHGSVHQGTSWQQQQEDRMMLDVLLTGGDEAQPPRQRAHPSPHPHSSGLLSAAFNPRPKAKGYDAFAPPLSNLTSTPLCQNNNDPRAPSLLHQQFHRPINPLATCQSVHEGGLYAAAAACHDGAAYNAIMNGGQAQGGMNLGGPLLGSSFAPLSSSHHKRTSSSGHHSGNPATSASYSLGRQPSSLSLAAAAAAAEAGGLFAVGSASSKQRTFGSLNASNSRLEAAANGRDSLISETNSEAAVRGGSLYLSTVAGSGGGQKRVLDLNSVPPPSLGSKASLPRYPGSFRGSLNGSLDIPSFAHDPSSSSPLGRSLTMEDTPRSKALHSTLVTSPSMHCSTLNSVQGYSSQDSIRRGFSIDGKGVSMEQVYGRFQSHNPPGALSAYLASDQLDVNLPNSLSRHSTLQRANSSFMAPLQENQPSDLIQQNFPLTGAKAVVDPDRVAQLYRYRLKKINRLKAYAQDSLQEKKVRQSSRQNRIKGNSGRLGSRDDESAMTAGTGTGTPDGSSENKEREANGEEDTSRIRHEINMIHLGFAGEVGGLSGQITDRELHDLGMSLVGPLSSAGGLGLPPPFSWPESNMIPEETPMGSSPPLVLKPSEATGLLMPEVEDKAHHLPHDTTDLLDAILSDNFNPSDLLL